MKKIYSLITLVLLLAGLSACGDDYTNEQIYSYSTELLNKSTSISNDQEMNVSKSNAVLEWTYSVDSKISLTSEIRINNSATAQLAIKDAFMEYDSTKGLMVFTADNGGNGITNVKGYYNPGNFTVYLEFVYNNSYKVTSVAQLSYPYVNAAITNTQTGGEPFESNNMGIAIVVNPTNMTAKMKISNLQLSGNGGLYDLVIFAEGLNVTAIANGYKVSGTNLESNEGEFLLDSFDATVTNDGLNITGTFTANSIYSATFAGKMFSAE